ncbi:alpha/beta hydrolase [Nocardia thailandica]
MRIRPTLLAALLTCCAALAAPAAAAPGAHLSGIDLISERVADIAVYSAAMDTTVRARVLRAADPAAPAPVLYLLNGANGGTGGSWYDETDVARFFAGKQVTVVIPVGGAGSYFTDWQASDPVLGRPLWTTFLTRELPPIVDAAFAGTGANAVAGISMAGTSVFQLAESAPGLYRAIGSYSGCVGTSTPQEQAFVAAVVARYGGNATNMWGPPGGPAWIANDPARRADRLRGTSIYVSTGTGLPGEFDTLAGTGGDAIQLTWQLLFGSPLEILAHGCALRLRTQLADLDIPATFDLRPTGTHSWGYWQQDPHTSWPQFEQALR